MHFLYFLIYAISSSGEQIVLFRTVSVQNMDTYLTLNRDSSFLSYIDIYILWILVQNQAETKEGRDDVLRNGLWKWMGKKFSTQIYFMHMGFWWKEGGKMKWVALRYQMWTRALITHSSVSGGPYKRPHWVRGLIFLTQFIVPAFSSNSVLRCCCLWSSYSLQPSTYM